MAFATRVSGRDFDELVRSKLKIFLSVDVVGSTALKQQGRKYELPDGVDDGPEFVSGDWLRFLTNFYRDFPAKLADAFEEFRVKRTRPTGAREIKPPVLWKALGDELIFTAELCCPEDAAIHLEALASAINSSVIFWTEEGDCTLPISFKGTAWVAGFPVGNSEIPMARAGNLSEQTDGVVGDDHYDYSGPMIDIGFRLAKLASPRRLILSAELADLVIQDQRLERSLRVEAPSELKGVLRGRPYPIIWLDCYSVEPFPKEKRLASAEDDLFSRSELKKGAAAAYFEAWFGTVGDCFQRPFIFDLSLHKSRIPDDHEENRRKVAQQLERIYKPTSENETDDGSDEGDEKTKILESLKPPGDPGNKAPDT